ncbi:MAG TPA: tail fiber domain-containing protein [Polyangiaceae bacterium]|nr:tail fiber domain-containing protein [Polyangiaceae bacterium]
MKYSIAHVTLGMALLGSGCAGSTAVPGGHAGSGANSTGGIGNQAGSNATGGASGRAGDMQGGAAPAAGSSGAANAPPGGGGPSGGGAPGQCQTTGDCPQLGVPCQQCPDGTYACPTIECRMGQCVGKPLTCPTQTCKVDADCPKSEAPCQRCEDGTNACPWARCENGTCKSGIDHCADGAAGSAGSGGSCAAESASCANGETCCAGLQCCAGVPVPAGMEHCGKICPKSDQNIKRDFSSVDPDQILEKLSSLPIGTWAYRTESTTARHIGPMAQDFMAAFQVGSSDRTILQVDADGVAFAAIQALYARLKTVEEQNQKLRHELDEQRNRCEP